MALKETDLARRENGKVEFRAQPLRAQWAFTDLPSADAHAMDCRFSCSIRVAENSADQRMCIEVLLGNRDALTIEQATGHFSSNLRAILESHLHQYKAADAIGDESQRSCIDALTRAATPIAFASGLELLPPFTLDVQSHSLQREKLNDLSTARQLQHLRRADELLQQFESMRQSSPHLLASQLLQKLDPADQGQALRSLLHAGGARTKSTTLWAVAGPAIMRIDLQNSPPGIRLIEIPADTGPMRSVQKSRMDAHETLLIGAQKGVVIVDPDRPSEARQYLLPEIASLLGFNRVVANNSRLWASHSEAGIVSWDINDPSHFIQHESAPAKRLAVLDEFRLIYATGERVVVLSGDAKNVLPSASRSPVIAILPCSRMIVIVREDGLLEFANRTDLNIIETRRRPDRISAACVLPWMNDVRILLSTETGAIVCIGLDDSQVTEYISPYRGMKIVQAASDIVAAVTPDRQRIVLWESWNGHKPVGEIHVAIHAKHRVTDIAMG